MTIVMIEQQYVPMMTMTMMTTMMTTTLYLEKTDWMILLLLL